MLADDVREIVRQKDAGFICVVRAAQDHEVSGVHLQEGAEGVVVDAVVGEQEKACRLDVEWLPDKIGIYFSSKLGVPIRELEVKEYRPPQQRDPNQLELL